MFIGIGRRADTLLVGMHAFLWSAVIVVWIRAWQVQPEPMGPPFRFAQGFISFIDDVFSSPVESLSVTLALKAHQWFGVDLGLAFVILFAGLILVAGTVQWFLIGRLIHWLGGKWRPAATLMTIAVACWVFFGLLMWSRYWAHW
jgi:hypothetical protein